jgi:transposase
MPRPYSNDLRARVIEAIEAGASRREAADRYELSPNVVVMIQRWNRSLRAYGSGIDAGRNGSVPSKANHRQADHRSGSQGRARSR